MKIIHSSVYLCYFHTRFTKTENLRNHRNLVCAYLREVCVKNKVNFDKIEVDLKSKRAFQKALPVGVSTAGLNNIGNVQINNSSVIFFSFL